MTSGRPNKSITGLLPGENMLGTILRKLRIIDIVLENKEYSTFRLVIECTRVKADIDARLLHWLFLVEDSKSAATNSVTQSQLQIVLRQTPIASATVCWLCPSERASAAFFRFEDQRNCVDIA
jgi:hypothetical protein